MNATFTTASADRRGTRVRTLAGDMARIATTRRELLAAGAATGALALLPGCATARRRPRVAIVGAGIAGLTAALVLRDAGVSATVYEASGRVGGRMHTGYAGFGPGQHVELGAEFVDSDHTTVRRLARRFRLELRDVTKLQPRGSRDVYRIGGVDLPAAEVRAGLAALAPALRRDSDAAGDVTWRHSSATGRRFDRMTVAEWLDANVPDGPIRPLLDAVFTEEYAADPVDLSALNLIWDLSERQPRRGVRFFASDERFAFADGTQALCEAVARRVGEVELQRRMTAVAQTDRAVTLTVDGDEIDADQVILALPFAVLRDLDFAHARFDARKRKAIDELGRGRNTKLALQFDGRPWDENGTNGSIYTDAPFTTSWDASRGQPGPTALLTGYTGGTRAIELSRNPNATPDTLAQLENAIPGLAGHFTGHARLSALFTDPNIGLSYAYVAPGQFSTIHGYERVAQGRIHFAGEHCSVEYAGFMEGAAREGARAAREVLSAIER
jgi:monoamine oxidase